VTIQENDVERPVAIEGDLTYWGSDAVAAMLRNVGVPYVAMVPGSSYRGLQDSLVNYLQNQDPRILVTLHEEHAVAIAHGYAKVTEKPMAAGLHSNVGLMHATMAIYNAYCDRMPILLLGATGPVDSTKRRPWIDWIHTSRDQGSLVRHYVKWDEQPSSPQAAVEAVARAWMLINSHPRAPAYVCLDVADQERQIDAADMPGDAARLTVPMAPSAAPSSVDAAVKAIKAAKNPVILAGRVSRDAEAWKLRIAFAEALGARVITDMKTAASFPTQHPLHVGESSQFLSAIQKDALAKADLVISLDWMDLGGTMRQAFGNVPNLPPVVQISLDNYLVNGWNYDHYSLPTVDVRLDCTADLGVELICGSLGVSASVKTHSVPALPKTDVSGDSINLSILADTVRAVVTEHTPTYMRFPLGWPADKTPFVDPLSYLGADGGAGVGSGPGIAIGAALALQESGRLPVAILGDGDFVMGANALWTATHYRIPMLIVVANNVSYFNDELHQEAVAQVRGRPVENRWIGQSLANPEVDIPALARSFGAIAPASVTEPRLLEEKLREAVQLVLDGNTVVLDVRVQPGYASAMPSTLEEAG
jgi:thiamine pyrophosphate-dependent acetolactate synthase large subunit-like protein